MVELQNIVRMSLDLRWYTTEQMITTKGAADGLNAAKIINPANGSKEKINSEYSERYHRF